MSTTTQKSLLVVFAVAVGTIGLFWNGDISPDKQKGFVSTADAIRGASIDAAQLCGGSTADHTSRGGGRCCGSSRGSGEARTDLRAGR